MNKIIREIAVLLWKTLKIVAWKWLRPMLGRFVMWGLIFAGLIILAVIAVASRG